MTTEETEKAEKVQVYVYDISHGLAKLYSQSIVGISLDAIYHTGVVVYGKEYYFDREGATITPAGQSRFGTPIEILDAGETYIPQEIFEEFLNELKYEQFKLGSYNLFQNNCNHFTHEALQFLNGGVLEDRILNLPDQVLNSPNGMMIQQLFNGGML